MATSTIISSQLLYERFFLADHYERVKALHDEPMFRPAEYIVDSVVPEVVAAFLFVSAIYLLSFLFVERLLPKATSSGKRRRKLCYQVTNFFANLVLGVTGFYRTFCLTERPTMEEVIQRKEDQMFATFQLGYQLWAIPVGLFLVNEAPTMLLHHVAVINASCVMIFFTNGLRYWCPFLMGAVELSSVPLAVMNAFKDNRDWIERYPTPYLLVRTLFAVLFLYIRVWMFMPRNLLQSYDQVTLLATNENMYYKAFHFSVFLSSSFLTFLQLKWGVIIIIGLNKVWGAVFGNLWMKVKRD